jgi:hypothetical protein
MPALALARASVKLDIDERNLHPSNSDIDRGFEANMTMVIIAAENPAAASTGLMSGKRMRLFISGLAILSGF